MAVDRAWSLRLNRLLEKVLGINWAIRSQIPQLSDGDKQTEPSEVPKLIKAKIAKDLI